MINAQEWLDKKYTEEAKERIDKLDIRDRKLAESLIIDGFDNLEYLDCGNNELIFLEY